MAFPQQTFIIENTFIRGLRVEADAEEGPSRCVLRRTLSAPSLRTVAPALDEPRGARPEPKGPLGAGQGMTMVFELMDAAATTDAVLEIAFHHLFALGPEGAADALYLAARKLPPAAQHAAPATSPLLAPLLMQLEQGVAELRAGRRLSQLAWALGKLSARDHVDSPLPACGVDACMLHVCESCPTLLAECTAIELSNTLWSLGRLYPGLARGASGGMRQVGEASAAIIQACAGKVHHLTAQSLANSLWALARLKVQGPGVQDYVALALGRLRSTSLLKSFTSQGLANVLWALAHLRIAGVCAGPPEGSAQMALIALAEASSHHLSDFMPQELSMAAWSFAKLYGARQGARGGHARAARFWARPAAVDSMLLKLAAVATRHIDSFEDQGVSNVAWALATLGLTGSAPTMAQGQGFLEAAMGCTRELRSYSTQAVANLLWACTRADCGRTRKGKPRIARFCSVAAEVMTERMISQAHAPLERQAANDAVTWTDLSAVAVALSRSRQKAQPVARYMTLLSHQAARKVAEGSLATQQTLNIAHSVCRVGVPPKEMQALVDSIDARIVSGELQLNDLDAHQWNEVQQWCSPSRLAGRVAHHCSGFHAQASGHSMWDFVAPGSR